MVNKIDFTTIADQLYTFPIIFELQPIGHSIKEKEIVLDQPSKIIITESTYKIKPYLKINGSGNITLTINNKSIILTNIIDYIEIDCECEEVYKDSENCNNKANCNEFPILIPGENNIDFIGDVSEVQIKYREAFL